MTDKPELTVEPSEIEDTELDEVSGGPIYVKIDSKTDKPPSITDGTSNTIR